MRTCMKQLLIILSLFGKQQLTGAQCDFTCTSGECLTGIPNVTCNGIFNCADQSDEKNCSCSDPPLDKIDENAICSDESIPKGRFLACSAPEGYRLVPERPINVFFPFKCEAGRVWKVMETQVNTTIEKDDTCENRANVALLVDRSGSVKQMDHIKNFLVNLVENLEPDCFPTAVLAFARKTEIVYGFESPESTDRDAARLRLDDLQRAKGDTMTHVAFTQVEAEFQNVNNVSSSCNVVVLFTDGGSDKKQETLDAAASLAQNKDNKKAWVCVVGYKHTYLPDSNVAINRWNELNNIVNNSNPPNSKLVEVADFINGAPGQDLIDKIQACIFKPC